MSLFIVVGCGALAFGLAVIALLLLRKSRNELRALRERFAPVLDVEAERARGAAAWAEERSQIEVESARLRAAVEQSRQAFVNARDTEESALAQLRAAVERVRSELRALDEEANLQSFGFYKPRYELATSQLYQQRLDEIRERQKRMLSEKTAAVCTQEWTVNGSRAEGKKQTNHSLKLILRAFNGECDGAIARVRYNNIRVMEERIRKAWEAINKLVEVQRCSITSQYLELKLEELQLAYEYQEKLQFEKEEQRRIRDQMREEEAAQRELEKARLDAEKEEQRFADALEKARSEVDSAVGAKQQRLLAQIEELQARLVEAQANKQRAIAQAQLTRCGHVYVISNIGSFGEHVYKIGMTRRLKPHERVDELGDASVPFEFDIHAMIYSEDAPTLENTLHREFHHRRVNRVNERKEFFRVSLDEIQGAVRRLHDPKIEFVALAEAEEYRKTIAMNEATPGSAPQQPSRRIAAN